MIRLFLDNDISWELGVEMSPYDRLNSEANYNKCDLRLEARHCGHSAYRLVVSVRDDPDIHGYIQHLAHKERGEEDLQFFGRIVN